MVVTGDPEQTDLPDGETSGLTHLLRLIGGSDIAMVHRFETKEIIRNDLVARIEALYSQEDGEDSRRAVA
jgi:phosphate starvation-inducible PhoH-like protein